MVVQTHSDERAEAFIFGLRLQSSTITVPPLLGLSVLFLERQNPDSTLFFSACVPFSWLSGSCHMKTMAGTRWKTHKPTYANPSLSQWLQALSCTFSKLWYITFKTPILTHKALTHALFSLAMRRKCWHNCQAQYWLYYPKRQGWGYWLMNTSYLVYIYLVYSHLPD